MMKGRQTLGAFIQCHKLLRQQYCRSSGLIPSSPYEHHCFDIDLRLVNYRLVNQLKLEQQEANERIDEYRHFLYMLLSSSPDQIPVPSPDINEVWQAHILHTGLYMKHCHSLNGEYVHHSPLLVAEKGKYSNTLVLYESIFARPANSVVWPRVGLFGRIKSYLFSPSEDREDDRSEEDKVSGEAYRQMDLSHLYTVMKNEGHYSCEEILLYIKEYRKFMQLLAIKGAKGTKYPSISLVPSPIVDEVWHCHILHTASYMAFCSNVAGRYIHHVPSAPGTTRRKEASGYNYTLHMYLEHFGKPYRSVWPLVRIPSKRDEALAKERAENNNTHHGGLMCSGFALGANGSNAARGERVGVTDTGVEEVEGADVATGPREELDEFGMRNGEFEEEFSVPEFVDDFAEPGTEFDPTCASSDDSSDSCSSCSSCGD